MHAARAALAGLATLLTACASASAPPAASANPVAEVDAFLAQLHTTPASPAEVAAHCDAVLSRSQALRSRLEAPGPNTMAVAFAQYDALSKLASAGYNDVNLLNETHPNADIRAAGEACIQRLSAFFTEISLSRPIYDRLAAIPASSLDETDSFVLARALGDYRRAGVDRDDATRARIAELSNQITDIDLEFSRNIRDDVDEVTFRSATDLAGVPADYLAAHQPGADGLIRVNTNTPDVFPILNYATNAETRRRVYMAYRNRAFPQNDEVLHRLLQRRYELAQVLGRDTYATLITEDKMVGSPDRAQRFLDELAAAARPAAQRDYQRQLARLQRIERGATSVPQWSTAYVQQMLQREDYSVDAQEVRRYFAYDNVRDGIFQLTTDLFGVEIRPWANAPVWHESVEAYEMWENGQLIGRFFLDNHPREGKFNHAAHFSIRDGSPNGRDSVQISALVCNFPGGGSDAGLMEHSQVETFLHEFGHLLHAMFASRQRWSQMNYGEVEQDFIEAPSSFLEEWVWDYETLSRFAVDENGQTIPRTLVERMNAARSFGQAQATLVQLGYAAVSLNFYHRNPQGADFEQLYRDQFTRYSVSPLAEGTHHYAQFGHLTSYSAVVYTYEWSTTIALDMFTQFQQNGLRDRATAARYRELILAPGGSRPADTLVQNFLGRPWNTEAYRRRLAE
jgi:thimet oligopeptidase